MASLHPLTSLKRKLYLLPIFLLLITLSSCNEEDNKKSDQTFTVTFSVGEGSAVASQRVSSGSKATEPSPAPIRSDYSFEGWYTSAGALFDFNTAITANITLSAKWTAITSTVTITYPDITAVVNTSLTAVTPTKAPAEATGTFNVKAGTLPDGLSLDENTGAISGTPMAAVATTTVTIEFVGTGSYTGTVETTVNITVNRATVNTITYLDITGAVNTSLTAVVSTKSPTAATGTFNVKSGSTLPDGLTLNPSTGAISGTPTAIATTTVTIEFVGTGSYTGTVETTVTIAVTGRAINSITYPAIRGIAQSLLAIAVTPTKIPAEATGMFRVKSGSTALPAGLSLNSSIGVISGRPTAAATNNVTIEFVGTGNYTGTVETTVMIDILRVKVTPKDVSGVVGTMLTPVTPTVQPGGIMGIFDITPLTPGTALPAGLSFDENTGVISGTPTESVSTRMLLRFTGTGVWTQAVTSSFALEIRAAP